MGNYRFDDNIHGDKPAPAGQRGIGCIVILVLPILSYYLATLLIEIPKIRSLFKRISPSLFGKPNIPRFLWDVKAIKPVLSEIYSWTNLGVNLLLGFFVLLVLTGIFAVIYSAVFRAMNPKYGDKDAPPVKSKGKSKSR